MQIKGTCFTNLDKFQKEKWPEVFTAVPRKGEYVAADGGIELCVVKVTHCSKAITGPGGGFTGESEPFIVVELHRSEWWYLKAADTGGL
ncbi:MAG: hypothetical protein JRL30_01235 [Deltaproteobacteria bacterium]|nr:hypothetical protein [Deltaproteobacteria bacterium]